MAYFAISCVALCVAMMLIVISVMNGFLDKIEADMQAEIDRIAEEKLQEAAKEEADRIAAIEKREADMAAKEAELKAKEVALKAEQDKAAKVERARLAKEQDATRETNRLAKIEAERVADVEHQANVRSEIRKSILGYVRNGANADFLIDAIHKGEIPHIQIIY